jgi:hypothetical protein
MDPKSQKPLRLFVNPLATWTDLVLKSGEAILASAHVAAVRANPPKVAAIPAADAPPFVQPHALKAKAPRSKTARAKARRDPRPKRRARR